MATKEKKGAKFGRHARNPSSKLQAQRSERNKRRNIEKATKRGNRPQPAPDFPRARYVPEVTRTIFGGSTPDYAKSGRPLHLYYSGGVLIEISPHRLDGFTGFATRVATEHRVLNPISGTLSLIESRPWR